LVTKKTIKKKAVSKALSKSTDSMSDREYVNVVVHTYGGLLDDVLTKAVDQWDLSIANNFDERVKICRDIIKNGEGKGLIPRTISAMIQSAVGKSTFENSIVFPSNMSEREKTIWTKYIENINFELKDATPGINQFREWWFREWWTSSFPLSYWTYGYEGVSPRLFIMNPLAIATKFSGLYGENKYYIYKGGDTTDITDKNTEYTQEIRTKEIPDGYIPLPLNSSDDFQVTKRGSQIYDAFPVPYLVQLGVASLHKYKESCRKSDTSIMKALVKMILHFRKGTDAMAQNHQLPSPEDIKDFAKSIKEDLIKSKDKPAVIVSGYDENISYITPDTTSLSDGKFREVDKDIAEGLGWITVEQTRAERANIIYNPKMIILEIESAVRKNNEVINFIFKKVQKKLGLKRRPTFLPPIMDIWLTDEAKVVLTDLFKIGLLTRKTAINSITSSDYEAERQQHIKEIEKDDETVFEAPIVLRQEAAPVSVDNNNKKEEDKKDKKTASFIYGENVDEELLEDFYKAGLIVGAKKISEESGKHWTEHIPETIYEEAPYKQNRDLSPAVKKLSENLQTVWRKAFNSAWDTYKDKPNREELCFRVSWSVVNKVRNKND